MRGSPRDPGRAPVEPHPPSHPGARPVPCPYCETTTAVRQTSDTGRIQAWACDRCNTDWAFTVPDSRTAAPLGDLGATAEEIRRLRWKLAQVVAVANDAPGAHRSGAAGPVAGTGRVGRPVLAPGWATSPLDSDVATGEEIGRYGGYVPQRQSA